VKDLKKDLVTMIRVLINLQKIHVNPANAAKNWGKLGEKFAVHMYTNHHTYRVKGIKKKFAVYVKKVQVTLWKAQITLWKALVTTWKAQVTITRVLINQWKVQIKKVQDQRK